MNKATQCAMLDRTQLLIKQLKVCKSDRRRLRARNAFDMKHAEQEAYRRGRKHGVYWTVGGAVVVVAVVAGVFYAVGQKK